MHCCHCLQQTLPWTAASTQGKFGQTWKWKGRAVCFTTVGNWRERIAWTIVEQSWPVRSWRSWKMEKGTKFRTVKKESNGASKDSCGYHTMWNRHENKASSSKAPAVLHAGAIKRPGQRVFKEPADLQAMKRLAALERQVGQLVWETALGQAGKKKKGKGKRREKPFQAWKHFLSKNLKNLAFGRGVGRYPTLFFLENFRTRTWSKNNILFEKALPRNGVNTSVFCLFGIVAMEDAQLEFVSIYDVLCM